MVGILGLVVIIGGYVMYCRWLLAGIKPREFDTHLPATTLRSLFEEKVARTGWKIVDDGNPIVAQSSLTTGVRQQIGLTLKTQGERTSVNVGPHRWRTKWGIPKKGHTLRIRLNSFVDAVRSQDPAINVELAPLRRR